MKHNLSVQFIEMRRFYNINAKKILNTDLNIQNDINKIINGINDIVSP